MPAIIILLVVIAACIISWVKIVPEAHAYVIEFLGSYQTTWNTGLHVLIPFVNRVSKRVSLKEQVGDFPPQPVITKDNVTMQIDTVVYYTIFDPKLFTYGVENPIAALSTLTATTLRNIIGEMELDETLTSRDTVNAKMQAILDEATDSWGIKVNRVELKNIVPPRDIQEAMEKQMRAEREKRQTLLEAQAHKEASITRAEGDKQAMILQAEAQRDAAIAIATGEAESIRLKYEAEAKGLENLAKTPVNEAVLMLRKLDALKALGDGRATKLVVPTELMKSAGDLSYTGELLGLTNDIDKSPKEDNSAPPADICCNEEERSDVTKELSGLDMDENAEYIGKKTSRFRR